MESEDRYLKAARAYCLHTFSYEGFADEHTKQEQIRRDAEKIAKEPWLIRIVDAVTVPTPSQVPDDVFSAVLSQMRAEYGSITRLYYNTGVRIGARVLLNRMEEAIKGWRRAREGQKQDAPVATEV